MSDVQIWNAVDDYFTERLLPQPDVILESALEAARERELPQIQVSPPQGRLLQLLVAITGSRRILEVGTLGGYSTIWLSRGIPELDRESAKIVTLEINPTHAEVARANFERAGLSKLIEVREGPAVTSMARIIEEGSPPFDFFFIDADKANNPAYFESALALSHKGTVIVVDNVVRHGGVADAGSSDPDIVGTRKVIELIGSTDAVDGTAIQTVGVKGYDGFAVALVTRGR